VAGLLLSSLVAPAHSAATPKPAPPPPAPVNPSNSQLSSASAEKNSVAAQVGQLGGEIAAAQAELQRLQGAQELAEQKVAFAVSKLQQAKDDAAAARRHVEAAARAVVAARKKFVQYLQASYMGGDLSGTAGSLLTAQDPTALLDRGTLEQYQADKQINAMGNLQRATVAKSNADAAARLAVRKRTAATQAAKAAKLAADRAVADAKAQAAALRATLATKQQELQAAQLQLATLNGQRANYVAWQGRVQRYNAALAAWRAEQARIAAARARAARLAAERAARLAAERAARAAAHHRHSGSSSHSSGGGSSYVAPSSPSVARSGAAAVRRAMTTLGTRYIWAGGNRYGPTDGGCTDPIASCGTVGYDCSGLVLYAWGRSWDHYAKNQYWQAGSFHPRPGHFKLGDLLFWSGSGTRNGIHHVAIYIGHGDVIQAPQSGDVVRITPWDQVENDYYGATRPLT
jgi:cell wall-associated NlpC family hydrolase